MCEFRWTGPNGSEPELDWMGSAHSSGLAFLSVISATLQIWGSRCPHVAHMWHRAPSLSPPLPPSLQKLTTHSCSCHCPFNWHPHCPKCEVVRVPNLAIALLLSTPSPGFKHETAQQALLPGPGTLTPLTLASSAGWWGSLTLPISSLWLSPFVLQAQHVQSGKLTSSTHPSTSPVTDAWDTTQSRLR